MRKEKTSKKEVKVVKESYQLSENSIKSTYEFGEANATFSLLYSRFKQVIDYPWDRKRLNRFKKLILNIIRSGPQDKMGKRKLWDGDLEMLENLQLNHKATAGNLFRKEIKINADAQNGINVFIEPFKFRNVFEKAHPKTKIAEVRLFVFCFDLEAKTANGKSIVLLRLKPNEDSTENFEIDFPITDNCLTLFISKVSFRSGDDLKPVMDRQYIGATVEKCVYMKNGKIMNYKAPTVENIIEPELPIGEWEDLD